MAPEAAAAASPRYPVLSENGRLIAERRYLLHTPRGELLETPAEMWRRVAHAIAAVEHRYATPLAVIEDFEAKLREEMALHNFVPAGRTLANAGAPTPIVPNCVVLHIEDSMNSIFETLKDAAMLQQKGSGIGFPLHLMRPAGEIAHASLGVASGPVSFLRVYDTAFTVIKQHSRNGANMAVMSVEHPDILEFIGAKAREGDIQNFNISVGLTREFMERVERDEPGDVWYCHFGGKRMLPRRITRDSRLNLLKAEPVEMTPRALFREIVEYAWRNGEPGCAYVDGRRCISPRAGVFLSTANENNPLPGLGRLEATNPCGVYFR